MTATASPREPAAHLERTSDQLQPNVIGSKVLGHIPSVLRSARITVNMPW
jgi:hypothetical protein